MATGNKLGPPVSIDKALTTSRNRVLRVGIELEGGWKHLPSGTRLVRDASIRFDSSMKEKGLELVGELSSRPLTVEEYSLWMETYYPHFVNGTCGLHVHLSFRTSFTYHKLMVNTYPSTLLAYISQWARDEQSYPTTHPIWARLAGKSEYCQHTFYADLQAQRTQKDYDHHREGNRYSVINYCHAMHGTLESRLLPMFDTVAESIAAVKRTIQITNAFLAVSGKREEKLKGKYTADDTRLTEEKKEFV